MNTEKDFIEYWQGNWYFALSVSISPDRFYSHLIYKEGISKLVAWLRLGIGFQNLYSLENLLAIIFVFDVRALGSEWSRYKWSLLIGIDNLEKSIVPMQNERRY